MYCVSAHNEKSVAEEGTIPWRAVVTPIVIDVRSNFQFSIKCCFVCHTVMKSAFNYIVAGWATAWVVRIVSVLCEASMKSSIGNAIVLCAISLIASASSETNETVSFELIHSMDCRSPVMWFIHWRFSVASRSDYRTVCIVRSSAHIKRIESHSKWSFGNQSTVSVVCVGAGIYKSWTAICVRRFIDQRRMGVDGSSLYTRLHNIQFGIWFAKSQSAIHFVDVKAYNRT